MLDKRLNAAKKLLCALNLGRAARAPVEYEQPPARERGKVRHVSRRGSNEAGSLYSLSSVRYNIGNVGTNCASRCKLARALTVKHRLAQHVAFNHDTVENAAYASKRIGERNEPWRNHGKNAVIRHFGVSYELYRIAEPCGDSRVLARYFSNALNVNIVRRNYLSVSQSRQNNYLACRIKSLNVGCGIFLGIALCLSIAKRIVKCRALVHHFGKNVVGGAVENAVYLDNVV